MIMDGNYDDLKAFANPDSVLDKASKVQNLETLGLSLKGKVAIVTGGGRGSAALSRTSWPKPAQRYASPRIIRKKMYVPLKNAKPLAPKNPLALKRM